MSAPSAPSVPPLPRVPPPPRHAPRRGDCPWCGSRRLRGGRGAPDRCRDCRHRFPNPPPAEDPVPPAAARLGHRLAARAVLRHCPEPESWLDVGTGDAGLPRAARPLFPYTAFDGLGTGHRVLRARAAEHVEEAHLGRLTDPHIAARLRARYDVVSLLGHLERVPDPHAELRAALHVLRPGGHLLIGSADPCRLTPHPRGLRAELRDLGCALLTGPRAHHLLARAGSAA